MAISQSPAVTASSGRIARLAVSWVNRTAVIGTAHKHGINAYTAIREALSGNPDIIFS